MRLTHVLLACRACHIRRRSVSPGLVRTPEHDPLLGELVTLGVDTLGLPMGQTLKVLLEGDAQRLGAHRGSADIDLAAVGVALALVLDLVLASLGGAVRDEADVLAVESGDKVL